MPASPEQIKATGTIVGTMTGQVAFEFDNWYGDVIVRANVENQSLDADFDGALTVGHDVQAHSELSIGADGGLMGQVIINADTNSGVLESGATVVVGSTSLTPQASPLKPRAYSGIGISSGTTTWMMR